MKFKVGDKVKIKDCEENRIHRYLSNYIGDEVEIFGVKYEYCQILMPWKIKTYGNFYHRRFELVKSNEVGMKFNVGDKVKIKYKPSQYGFNQTNMDVYEGKITTIIELIDNRYKLKIDDGDWYWDHRSLEKVKVNSIINLPIRAQLDKLGI